MGIVDVLRQKIDEARIFCDEPMSGHTTFRVGGPADVFVVPRSADEMQFVLRACRDNGVPCFVIGNGSNLLVRDGGISGVVVSTAGLRYMSLFGRDKIHAQAGVMLSELSKFAWENSLTGLEFAEGIPGSVGGGIAMNAGAFEGEMAGIFKSARTIDENCQIVDMDAASMDFGYRKSAAQTLGHIVTEAVLQLSTRARDEIAAKMADFRKRRQEKQPLALPSAGSVFKRPAGHFAGKLVMDAGLRGYKIGAAQVSEKHCGFIVNTGGAAAADIEALICHVQAVVLEKFGVALETEVKIVGRKRG